MQNVSTSENSPPTGSPYFPLDTSRGRIRLAIMPPGSFEDDLVIRLQVENISEVPPYEALSYVWGQDTSPRKALINDVEVTMTANLDCALRNIRFRRKVSRIWVDALCTNQLDTSERGAQIQLMRQIYASADKVLIWLGPADGKVVNVVREIQSYKILPTSADALIDIFRRPWFRRVWVAHELALAKSDPWVYLGSSSLEWSFPCAYAQFLHGLEDAELELTLTDAAHLMLELDAMRTHGPKNGVLVINPSMTS